MGIFAAALKMRHLPNPATPPSGQSALYFKSDGKLYSKNSSGTETLVAAQVSQNVSAPISYFSGTGARILSLGIGQTAVTNQVINLASVPNNAVSAVISVHLSAHASANAAVNWSLLSRFNLGSTIDYDEWLLAGQTKHNEGNPSLDIGFTLTAVLDVRNYRSLTMDLQVTGFNHNGSGAGIHPGWMNYSVTFMS